MRAIPSVRMDPCTGPRGRNRRLRDRASAVGRRPAARHAVAHEHSARLEGSGRSAGADRRALAGDVQRPGAVGAGRRGAGLSTPICSARPRASSRRLRWWRWRAAIACPSVGLSAHQERQVRVAAADCNAVFLNASLELDIWGRLRYVKAAAEAQSAATEADFAYARQSLAATGGQELVRRHRGGVAARDRGETVRSGGGAPSSRAGSVPYRQWGRTGGRGSRAPVSAATATRCGRPSRRASRRLRALELLLGRYPAAEIAVAQRLVTDACAGARGNAVGAPRTPAGRHRGRAPRRRRVCARRRSEGGAAARASA